MTSKHIIDEVRLAYPGHSVRVTRRAASVLYSDWEVSKEEVSFADWVRRENGHVSAVVRCVVSLEELG